MNLPTNAPALDAVAPESTIILAQTPSKSKSRTTFVRRVFGWFVALEEDTRGHVSSGSRIDWFRALPFLAMHVMCLGIIWVGWSWTAVGVAAGLYVIRMFAMTAFYHRYFSHRAFKTSRFFQFVFGAIGCSAVQRGPLWWAAHHRHHHVHSDDELDLHSPRQHGFFMSHVGWFLTPRALTTNLRFIPDFARFPELRFLNRFEMLVPALLAGGLFGLGWALEAWVPWLETSGWQLLIWGFFVSTVVLYHGTYLVNSLAHVMGRKRFQTADDSRNSFLIALFTLGEGWHNNHHHYPSSARNGFYWWEIDVTYYTLVVMKWCRIIWDLKPVPRRVLEAGRGRTPLPEATPAG